MRSGGEAVKEKVNIYVTVDEEGWVSAISPGPVPSCRGGYGADDAYALNIARNAGQGARNVYRVTIEVERPASLVRDVEGEVEEVEP
jgi:hypothetical protein